MQLAMTLLLRAATTSCTIMFLEGFYVRSTTTATKPTSMCATFQETRFGRGADGDTAVGALFPPTPTVRGGWSIPQNACTST
ncbi:hypothetical protein LZ32DRAFT_606959 [Colletotrichum eremochloae]|nr:hypothetical protein LZ32DRAFT_606959 [Colletotrichum eremochloae]